MYDKTVRRRRAVLALLVACSLILLTGYFGEGSGGPLHSVQRGVLGILSPVQEGANRALKPVRDMFGWFGDTFDAKSERDKLKEERNLLRREVSRLENAAGENEELKRLVSLDDENQIDRYKPVAARVITRSPTLWFATITINRGSGDGIRVNQPVVGDDGLVGKVTAVTGGTAVVTLITDESSGVSAKVNITRSSGANTTVGTAGGTIKTEIGNPNDLQLLYVQRGKTIREGDRVVTAGTQSDKLESIFPPGILIGRVTKVDAEELDLFQRVHVKPAADLRGGLDFVQVLTQSATTREVAQAP